VQVGTGVGRSEKACAGLSRCRQDRVGVGRSE
jgi:hypothetical protein